MNGPEFDGWKLIAKIVGAIVALVILVIVISKVHA